MIKSFITLGRDLSGAVVEWSEMLGYSAEVQGFQLGFNQPLLDWETLFVSPLVNIASAGMKFLRIIDDSQFKM